MPYKAQPSTLIPPKHPRTAPRLQAANWPHHYAMSITLAAPQVTPLVTVALRAI